MITILKAILFTIAVVLASRGDQSVDYQECVMQCSSTCSANGNNLQTLSLINKIMMWSCPEECQYQCMRKHVKQTRQADNKTYQYHGKWPFIRLFGMQEFFSVLFSVGNFYAQVMGFKRFRQAITEIGPKQRYRYSWLVFMMCLFNCNGWLWSSVFHARDWLVTERLDYFSAVLLVMFSLYFTIIRLLSVKEKYWPFVLLPFAIYYILHVSYLHFIKFDYSYNMAVTAGCGLLFNALWIVFGMKNWHKLPHSRKALFVGILFTLAGTLEVFDFPPILDLVDAHALWHLATIPITKLWYDFLCDDVRHCSSLIRREQK